ncbi:hypothetical protein EFW17_08150 [Halostreptopolyspora alba]|uniref:Uncharacterized protein n=1 Tax=Halostreptopolyspora alba TaxID=2487137 RepID=A0A3N0EC95_9ACTN|nr:hypothetical protein EFW17_08150 [Nocardiopsaceae bacterium YIM 96095]
MVVSGCGGESGPSQEELEEMIAPDDISGNAANDPDISELRFDPETVSCEPHANSSVAGTWRTSAPRERVATGERAEIGLRDTEETEETDELDIVARVLTPGEERVRAEATLSGGEWTTLGYPEDFPEAPESVANGTYTVVWTTGGEQNDEDNGTFISCDGFQVG